jgi:hypothetical protein
MEGRDPVSIADLREDSRRAARKVAQEGLRPYIVEADDLADLHLTIRAGVVPTLPFPFLGSKPTSFQQTENRYFLDPGFVPVDGTALTVQAFREPLRFLKYLREGYAYAVLKAEQFYIQEYMPARTSEAVQGGALTCSPLLAQVTAALQRGEELSDEVTEIYRSLEELQQRLARRLALLREAERYLCRGGDLSDAARNVVERIAVDARGTSDALGAPPEPIVQSPDTRGLALNPNLAPEAN